MNHKLYNIRQRQEILKNYESVQVPPVYLMLIFLLAEPRSFYLPHQEVPLLLKLVSAFCLGSTTETDCILLTLLQKP